MIVGGTASGVLCQLIKFPGRVSFLLFAYLQETVTSVRLHFGQNPWENVASIIKYLDLESTCTCRSNSFPCCNFFLLYIFFC